MKNHNSNMHGGLELQLHVFLTLTLDGGEWLALSAGYFTPRERIPDTPGQQIDQIPEPIWSRGEKEYLFLGENQTLAPRSSSLWT
jgi:hypothetical protein